MPIVLTHELCFTCKTHHCSQCSLAKSLNGGSVVITNLKMRLQEKINKLSEIEKQSKKLEKEINKLRNDIETKTKNREGKLYECRCLVCNKIFYSKDRGRFCSKHRAKIK